jgi:hypothetical protein
MELEIEYSIINSAVNDYSKFIQPNMPRQQKDGFMTELKVLHNAGFFSCATIALQDIMIWRNLNGCLPDVVDRSTQYANYKGRPMENLIPMLYKENVSPIEHDGPLYITTAKEEQQFSDYRLICFDQVRPFMDRYFMPSNHIGNIVYEWGNKYQVDYENTCGVFYRGNDKIKETGIAPYEEFINKAKEIQNANPDIRFLVQPDEQEFWEAFSAEIPNSFILEECHMMPKDTRTAIFFELPLAERPTHAAHFFASVLMLARCKHLITHSGNGGFWATLYRGNAENVHQYLQNKWL